MIGLLKVKIDQSLVSLILIKSLMFLSSYYLIWEFAIRSGWSQRRKILKKNYFILRIDLKFLKFHTINCQLAGLKKLKRLSLIVLKNYNHIILMVLLFKSEKTQSGITSLKKWNRKWYNLNNQLKRNHSIFRALKIKNLIISSIKDKKLEKMLRKKCQDAFLVKYIDEQSQIMINHLRNKIQAI